MLWVVCADVLWCGLYVAAHPHLPAPSYRVQRLPNSEQDGRVQTLLRAGTLTTAGRCAHPARAYWTYYPQPDAPPPMDGQRVAYRQRLPPSPQQNPYGCFDIIC